MSDRIAGPHKFWLETCGVDTHRRSADHARLDTPWNAFTPGKSALVCTLWTDHIVEIPDPTIGRARRFVKLGGKSRVWKGVAISHGNEARSNLEYAVTHQVPVFGYEAEPNPVALERGVRAVKHFHLDRAHQLKAWIGLSKVDLEERLKIEDAFRAKGLRDDIDSNAPATLFELVASTTPIPGVLNSAPALSEEEEDGPDDESVEGNLSSDEYARLALPILVAHVLQQVDGILVPMTYLELAQKLGRKNKHGAYWARGLGQVLGKVTRIIDSVANSYAERPPYLTSIVVLSAGRNAGLPDKGVSGYWPGYEALPQADKQAKVGAEYIRILAFGSRWNEILRLAGLTPIPLPQPSDTKSALTGGWAGGESQAHKELKRFVLEHPETFGADVDWFSQEEYALRSGDELDVMFKSERLWIGVEVKSRTSDYFSGDYERGIYQVVKYKAVLEAQARIDHPQTAPEVRVLLALESQLPRDYRELAMTLGVTYLENLSEVMTKSVK